MKASSTKPKLSQVFVSKLDSNLDLLTRKDNDIPGDDFLNYMTTTWIISTLILQLAGTAASSLLELGPTSAAVITYAILGIFVFFILPKNRLIQVLMSFSAVAGVMVLWGDDWAVNSKLLCYPGTEKIMSSPYYMPFAWMLVLTQLSYFGILLIDYFIDKAEKASMDFSKLDERDQMLDMSRAQLSGLLKAMGVLALAGALYIPLYEEMATFAKWWEYNQETAGVCHTPFFVILAEGILVLLVPILLLGLISIVDIKKTWKKVGVIILFGLAQGIWINLSAMIAYNGLEWLGVEESFCPYGRLNPECIFIL